MAALWMERIVERFGEYIVAERDVIPAAPHACQLIDRPLERAMIDDDVLERVRRLDLERIAVFGIRTFGVIARTHAQVLHEHVGSGDSQTAASQHDAGRRCSLPGDRDVRIIDGHIALHANRARHFEHADARPTRGHACAERSLAGVAQIRHPVDLAAAASGCVDTEAGGIRNHGKCIGGHDHEGQHRSGPREHSDEARAGSGFLLSC